MEQGAVKAYMWSFVHGGTMRGEVQIAASSCTLRLQLLVTCTRGYDNAQIVAAFFLLSEAPVLWNEDGSL